MAVPGGPVRAGPRRPFGVYPGCSLHCGAGADSHCDHAALVCLKNFRNPGGNKDRPYKPFLDETGNGLSHEVKPARADSPRSKLGRPEMRGGFKRRWTDTLHAVNGMQL